MPADAVERVQQWAEAKTPPEHRDEMLVEIEVDDDPDFVFWG